ncbi:MAG: imidazoleglycerol-phosphate dehydratase HisB [Deltaproteobacteria bacterium]|jgi:imidazoleglycerol-phosphate dehydratase|nr:imidazoleglycerol-phosphate dehydratase HisB [Deltaproteobacteria bacterium]
MARQAKIDRATKETSIRIKLDIDGTGKIKVDTGIPFMDHMLTLMAAHGFLDLEITAKGDTEVDDHHTVEDLGICLGKAIKEALGEKKGIRRYGEATIPMDEALARVVMDISNRPGLAYRVSLKKTTTGTFDVGLVTEFFRALVTNAGITMHVDLLAGDEPHHVAEGIFKAFARALDQACSLDNRLGEGVPSTKGLL